MTKSRGSFKSANSVCSFQLFKVCLTSSPDACQLNPLSDIPFTSVYLYHPTCTPLLLSINEWRWKIHQAYIKLQVYNIHDGYNYTYLKPKRGKCMIQAKVVEQIAIELVSEKDTLCHLSNKRMMDGTDGSAGVRVWLCNRKLSNDNTRRTLGFQFRWMHI